MNKPEKSKQKPVYIYLLIDPRDGTARYLGQTVRPETRLKEHLYPAKYKLKRGFPFYRQKNLWIKEVLEAGMEPQLKVAFSCSHENANAIETELMRGLLEAGYNLINTKIGA